MRRATIENAAVFPVKLRLLQDFATARGTHKDLHNVLLRLELADGTVGWGEAAVATHITGETIKETRQNLERAGFWLLGRDARDYASFSRRLNGELPRNKAVVAAVEMALLDALTRHRRIPLWRFFGRSPGRLSSDVTIVICSLPQAKKRARRFYAQGFRSFKIKVGRNIDSDIKRVAAVKSIVGQSRIFIDVNQGYSASQALIFLSRLEKLGVRPDLIEQPVPKEDWEGLKKVNRLSRVPVCADESVCSLADCRRAIRERAVGAVNVKLMKSGLIQAAEIACLARKAGLKLMIGGMMETSLAMTAAAHLAAGLGGFDFVDLDTPFFVAGDLKRNPYLTRSGVYDLGRVKSGIGIVP